MSDTIIVYENGKAIGGEGHPTNANEITFNNEGTDLVSEEVESAIKEVNAKFDRGSVSVTANGNKTYATLLTELYALIDSTKVSKNSVIEIGGTVLHLTTIGTGYGMGGSYSASDGSAVNIVSAFIGQSASYFLRTSINVSTNAVTTSNVGVNVAATGINIVFTY